MPDASPRAMPQTPLRDHPVFSIPPIGDPYRFGLWHQDRASLKGYAFEARISLKSLARRGDPRKFLILGRPRSGTTLLQRLLNQVEGLRCDGEVLHHAVLRPVDFLDRHARTRDTAIAGAKIISYQMFEVQRIPDHGAFLAALAARGFRFIHIRRNTYKQCLSLSTAQETQHYHAALGQGGASRAFALDPDRFERQVRWNLAMLDYEEKLLAPHDPLVIHYDRELRDAPGHQACIDRICRWLDHPSSPVHADLERTSARTEITNQAELKARLEAAGLGAALSDG